MTATSGNGLEHYVQVLRGYMAEDADFARRVNEHVKTVAGHESLDEFLGNGSTETTKISVAVDCILAKRLDRLDRLKTVEDLMVVEPEQAVEAKEAMVAVTPMDAAGQLVASLRALIGKTEAEIAPEKIEGLLNQKLADALAIMEERIASGLEELKRNAPPRDVVEVRKPEGGKVEVPGPTHWQLPQVVAWFGANVPLWLWGQAGGGKTTLGRQVAAALELEPFIVSIDPTMTVGKLLGFRNLATGEFIEGFLFKPYRDGGLVMLDEIDTGDPGIIASINALLANDHYLFPNGVTVNRHPNFRVIAGANTKG